MFATYLQGANLGKSCFSSFRTLAIRYERLELTDTIQNYWNTTANTTKNETVPVYVSPAKKNKYTFRPRGNC